MRLVTIVLIFGLVSVLSGCVREEAPSTPPATPKTETPVTPEAETPVTPETATPTAEKPATAVATPEPAVLPPEVEPATTLSAAVAKIESLSDATVEIACGKCVYKIEGLESCSLAAKIDGKPMLVVGDTLKTAPELGVCEEAKTATISGKIEDGKLLATKVELQ